MRKTRLGAPDKTLLRGVARWHEGSKVEYRRCTTTLFTPGGCMGRTAIVATIVTSILAFSSPSLAASDAEIVSLRDKMSGAFRCSTYAQLFHDQKEQQRLFQIGLKAGRDYVEGLKSRDDLAMGEMSVFILGVSTDFVVGQLYEAESTHAYDEIVKYQNGLPLQQ